MRAIDRVRDVLWAKGYSYVSPLLGLIIFVVFSAFPWASAVRGGVPLIQHYVFFDQTLTWLSRMVSRGQVDAVLVFLTAMILLPFAFFWAFRNRPIISGLLFIISGLLLIYLFKATPVYLTISELFAVWGHGFEPYSLGIATYAIIFLGGLSVFSQCYSKWRESKIEAAARQAGLRDSHW